MKNLEEISKNTGVSLVDLKEMLGLVFPCPYDNIDEVREIYNHSLSGSESERAAFYKLNYLISQKLMTADSFEEIKQIYVYAPRGSEIGEMVLLRGVSLCANLKDAIFIYNSSKKGSLSRKAAVKKIFEFYPEA